MRRVLPILTLLFIAVSAVAQNYKVLSMEDLPQDMTARDEMRKDENDQQCAVLKIVTQNISPENREGFYFEPDWGSYVEYRDIKGGEIRVWVSPGLKTLNIRHDRLGSWVLRVSNYGIKVEPLHTYKIMIEGLTPKDDGQGKPVVTQQFLQFNVDPKDAMVTVNGTPWQVMDGVASQRVNFGRYKYRVVADDYHAEEGTVEVHDSEKKVVKEVSLKPAFGFLKIEGDQNVLSKSSIFIDNTNGADALKAPKKLASKQYKVTVVNSMYKTFERTVTIKDGETTPLRVDLNANYSTVTLQVDADAEIYVDNEYKGTRSWTGDLVAGSYVMECRMKNHRPTSVRNSITDNMSGQTIKLKAPTPIHGVLAVSSNPPMAKIFLDGKPMGEETPAQFNSVLIGEHTLRLEKSGCATLTKTITIEEGKTLTIEEKLDTGRNITVKTDRSGDKVYVDGNYIGETPYNVPMGFGQHTVRVVRNGNKQEKKIEVTTKSRDSELFFEFGRLIRITTDQNGDMITVDGLAVGTSPVSVDMTFGKHVIHAQRGKKYADKDIVVQKDGGETTHRLVLHGESASRFVERGVNFVTLDGSYDLESLAGFGFSVGSVKKVGWFVTAMSNFSFGALDYGYTSDANGLVDGYYPNYIGESYTTRYSIMGGMLVKLGGPVYFRFGAGYGERVKSWTTTEGYMVRISNDSFSGLDATAGLQLNLKGFTMSLDAVTSSFNTLEVKLGLGYCWKR